MSEAGTATPEPDGQDQAASAARRFNVLVFLSVLGALGIVLFWAYRAFASITKDADEAGRLFGLLAPPQRKSRLSRLVGKGQA
jgi:hypothetical protein